MNRFDYKYVVWKSNSILFRKNLTWKTFAFSEVKHECLRHQIAEKKCTIKDIIRLINLLEFTENIFDMGPHF